jgi:hypothetical protein
LPAEFIEQLTRPLGEAFSWVADGSMNDLTEQQQEQDEPYNLLNQIELKEGTENDEFNKLVLSNYEH